MIIFKKKIRLFALLSVIVFSSQSLFAQSIAKYAGEFISTGVGARALGMGSAFVSVVDDVTAGYWNAAGLASIDYQQASVMHSERFAGIVSYDYAAYARPYADDRAIGFSMIRLGVEGIPNTTNALLDYGTDGIPGTDDPDGTEGNGQLDFGERLDEDAITKFSDSEWAFYLSYGRQLNERFAYGGSVKFLRKAFANHSANGLGFDVAMKYRFRDRWFIGANFQDVTTTMLAWDTGTKELISPTLRSGISTLVKLPFSEAWLMPSIEFVTRTDGDRSFSSDGIGLGASFTSLTFGGELHVNNRLILRAGRGEVEPFSASIGIKVRGATVDYSFGSVGSQENLGDTHRVSLLVDFNSGLWIE